MLGGRLTGTKKRILFVAMSDSIHTARWLNQLQGANYDVHLFPSMENKKIHPYMENLTIYHSFYAKQAGNKRGVKNRGVPLLSPTLVRIGRASLKHISDNYRVQHLVKIIKRIKPDLIHSLEIQHAAYLTLEAKKSLRSSRFPPWLVTNWGSDIFLYGRLAEHEPKIREVLSNCDYYACECNRDVELARVYGFKGTVLDVMPNTGGFDFNEVSKLRSPGPTSSRKKIMLKGYGAPIGRSLVGLRALELCADTIRTYEIVIYSADWSPEVKIAAELFTKELKIPIKIVPVTTSHNDLLKLHGSARISIGLGISDAISTSLLEALVMGSFPIQSFTSCANEWITDGITGYLVHPDDPEQIARAIKNALTNDALVDKASELNWNTAVNRLNKEKLKILAIENYEKIFSDKRGR